MTTPGVEPRLPCFKVRALATEQMGKMRIWPPKLHVFMEKKHASLLRAKNCFGKFLRSSSSVEKCLFHMLEDPGSIPARDFVKKF